MSDQNGNAIFYALLLILPLSALFARRLPLGRVAVMALAWIGIFATGLLIVALVNRNEWIVSGTRELFYGQDQSVVGSEVRVPVAEDGHFYARVTINGIDMRMLIDTGDAVTALTSESAAAAKVEIDTDAPPHQVMTANGVADAQPAMAKELKVGSITATDFPIDVQKSLDIDLLGMDFLSKLKSWRREGNVLVLVPNSK